MTAERLITASPALVMWAAVVLVFVLVVREDRRARRADVLVQPAEQCKQHPNAPRIGGMCGGCTQYPSDMTKEPTP